MTRIIQWRAATLDPEFLTTVAAQGTQQSSGRHAYSFLCRCICWAAQNCLLLRKFAAPRLDLAMGDFVPILTAVASGTFDSIENVFINIARHVPLLNNLRRRKELDQCLSGKVSLGLACTAVESVLLALDCYHIHFDEQPSLSAWQPVRLAASTALAAALAAAAAARLHAACRLPSVSG
jgi:hypothetical protein